jgi:hypothetical protein
MESACDYARARDTVDEAWHAGDMLQFTHAWGQVRGK